MLRYLVAVVQVALPAALLLALVFACLRLLGDGRRHLRWMAWGVGAGAATALLLAVVKSTTALVNREYVNLVLDALAIALEALFLFRLWRPRPRTGAAEWAAVPGLLGGVLVLYALPDVLLLPAQFATGDEKAFSTAVLLRAIGYLAGAVIVFLAALGLYKSSAGTSARAVRLVVTAAFSLAVIVQLVAMAQILLARGVIPMNAATFKIVVWVINHENAFLFALLGLGLVLPLASWRASRVAPSGYANPAEHRALRAEALSRRRFCGLALSGFALAAVSVTAVKAYDERKPVLSEAEPLALAADEVTIPLERIGDGRLHRFVYPAADGTDIRFIVIKRNEVAFGVGLDACNICGPTGYFERDGKVICQLCDVAINIPTIGFKGGCNPIPLQHTVRDGKLVVRRSDLEAQRDVFV